LSFGQPGDGGQPHRGLTIEARPGARLVAPLDGKIVFAGPFRTYGLILIIEHSEGYHTLLAGLGRIDGTVGQTVSTGEPVGIAGSAETGNPSIYVELRRNGQPIDPLPWLAPRNEKVSG
jgi:septal ring factor EnvC (AmiA/AmiB activator)